MKAQWLMQGHFDFGTTRGSSRHTYMMEARDVLDGLTGKHFNLEASEPVMVARTRWFREGNTNGAEAQFTAEIDLRSPVLWLGIGVERGAAQQENLEALDWTRMIRTPPQRLGSTLAQLGGGDRPLFVRVETAAEADVFVLIDDCWYRRSYKRGDSTKVEWSAVVASIRDLDQSGDTWGRVLFAHCFFPPEVEKLTPDALANELYRFEDLRSLFRPH